MDTAGLDRLIHSSMSDGLLAMDRDCRYIRWNPAMERISGLAEHEVLGKNAFELFPFLKEIGEDAFFARALAGDSVTSSQQPFRIPETGQSGFFEGNYSPLRDASGEIIGAVGIIRDITARVQAEKKMVETLGSKRGEERFRALVDRVNSIIWAADDKGQNAYTNQFGINYLGLSRDHLQFENWMPVIHQDDVSLVQQTWSQAFQEGRPFETQHRMKRAADGMYRWMLGRGHPIHDTEGRIVQWVGTVTDIHDRVIASQRSVELQSLTAELCSAVTPSQVADIFMSQGLKALRGTSAVIALLSVDRESAEIFASHGHPQSTIDQWKRIPMNIDIPLTESIRGRRPVFLESIEHAKQRYPQIVTAMEASGERSHAELPLIVENEVVGVLSVGFAEARAVDQEEERFMLTVAGLCGQAIERSRIYESELAARALAEAANAAKTNFLATVSHEIRTPLCSIIGYSELLMKPSLAPARRQEFLRGIDRNGKGLIRLVDDILELSKIESGQLSVEKVEFHLPSCLHEVVEILRQEADRKGIDFSFNRSPGAPRRVISDPLRLRQIFLNIVGNAIKFTERGFVKVTMTHEGREPSGSCDLVFRVEDSGIGLRREAHELLFQPFSQGHDSSHHTAGGTGLGLVIARNLARMLGGDARLVSSEPGRGSVFEFRIAALNVDKESPMEASMADESREGEMDAAALKGIRILVAEDAPDIQVIVSMLLTAQGAEVQLVANGQEAIEAALQHDFDVIVMDLQMPIVDGYQATKHLRNSGYTKPIIALTANAFGNFRTSLQSGFNAHILKPIDTNLLIQTVSDFAGKNSGREESAPGGRA